MVVFYYQSYDNVRRIDFIRWLGNCVNDADISYWAVPGTLEMLEG